MKINDFLTNVGVEGRLLYTQEIREQGETYYLIRLKDKILLQRFMIMHQDHRKNKKYALSIDSYYSSMAMGMKHIDYCVALGSRTTIG